MILYNGALSHLSGDNITSIATQSCVSKVITSSDVSNRHLYLITEDRSSGDDVTTNSLYTLSPDLTLTLLLDTADLRVTDSDSFTCVGSTKKTKLQYTSLTVVSLVGIQSLSTQVSMSHYDVIVGV